MQILEEHGTQNHGTHEICLKSFQMEIWEISITLGKNR